VLAKMLRWCVVTTLLFMLHCYLYEQFGIDTVVGWWCVAYIPAQKKG
jgi:hypothetical protein